MFTDNRKFLANGGSFVKLVLAERNPVAMILGIIYKIRRYGPPPLLECVRTGSNIIRTRSKIISKSDRQANFHSFFIFVSGNRAAMFQRGDGRAWSDKETGGTNAHLLNHCHTGRFSDNYPANKNTETATLQVFYKYSKYPRNLECYNNIFNTEIYETSNHLNYSRLLHVDIFKYPRNLEYFIEISQVN